MNYFCKISTTCLILILCALVVNLVTAEDNNVLNPGTAGDANVMSSSSSSEDANVVSSSSTIGDANVVSSSSGNLSNVMNSLPSVDESGDVINPSSDNLGNIMNSLPSEDTSAPDKLKVYYLNTSHGDATLLESSGHFMVINAGDAQDSSTVIDYLKKTGVKTLDYAVATNLDDSEIGGMTSLMEAFPVSVFSVPSTSFSSPTIDRIRTMVEDKQTGFQQAAPGNSVPFGDATIQFLNTSTSAKNPADNAMSVLVGAGSVTFLFTGNQNLSPEPATFWAVPEQGSDGTIASLSPIPPQFLIINAGTGGPDKKTLETLKKQKIETLLTNKDGNIIVTTDGNDYRIVTGNGKTLQKPTPEVTPTLQATPGDNSSTSVIRPSDRVADKSVI